MKGNGCKFCAIKATGLKMSIPINQHDLKSRIILKSFRSSKEAALETNTCFTSILKVCKGKQKSSNGFYWSFCAK